jgi:hypothetical protein
MNGSEHLTENQLNDYFGNHALKGEAKHRIGRHLLQCDFCLKRLPQPTTEQFWAALMTDEETEVSSDGRSLLAARLELIAQSLKQPKIFALGAASLAVVLFFSTFLWLSQAESYETGNEVVQNFETKNSQPVFDQTGDQQMDLPRESSSGDNNSSSPASTQTVSQPEPIETKLIKTKQTTKSVAHSNVFDAKKQVNLLQKENVALTRGSAMPKCDDQPAIDLTVEASNEKVVLKWKKVPKAAKYHLYISDEEEILIDEYETGQGTSYALTKPLDPAKTYQWKVIITLENGETVIGDARKFTVKDLKSNPKKSERKGKSEIRCTEDK